MARFLDLTGQRFGRLEVISFSRDIKSGTRNRKYWNCVCDCGNAKEVRTDSLTSGNVKSCGCIKKEQDAINLTSEYGFKPKYKIQNRRLYQCWRGMKRRCFDAKDKRYYRYGGRGITVCNEWLDYDIFAKWALNNGYREDLTIDRINNDGNYEPSNCKWSTHKEQALNRSTSLKNR